MTRAVLLLLASFLACSSRAELAPDDSGSRPRRCVESPPTPGLASDAVRQTVRWTTRLVGEASQSTQGIVTVEWTFQTLESSFQHVGACVETRDVPNNLYVRPLLHLLPHHGLDVELEIRPPAPEGTARPQHSLRWNLRATSAGATLKRDSGFEPGEWRWGNWSQRTRLQAQDGEVVNLERVTSPLR